MASTAPRTMRHRKKRLALVSLASLLLVWLSVDLGYCLVMKYRYARWDAGVERDAQGVRSGCQEYTVGSGDTAVLLLHGFGDSPAIFGRMAPALAERAFTCRAMRLPGFAARLEDYSRTTAAAWHEAVQSELRALRASHARVVLVAHSLGGAVAVDCLADDPGLADAVVLLAPLVEVSGRHSPLLSPEAWYRVLDHALFFTDRIGQVGEPELHDPVAAACLQAEPFIPRSIYRELFTLVARNRGRAPALDLPVLMVLGQNDTVVDNEAARRFFGDCPSATKCLSVRPDVGHLLPVDRGWQDTVGELADFIRDLPEHPRLVLGR